MDRIDAMKIFMRVADLNSFTRAADSLDLPKATVSNSLQWLENHLSARLFNRTTRRVQITAEGTAFYERCQDLLAELEETESMFRTAATQIKGKLRVDMTVPMARNLIIPLLPQFFDDHPEIEIELSSRDGRVDPLRENIDCVVRVGKGTESGLLSRELGQMLVVNCASEAYLKRYGVPEQIEDLDRHHLVHYVQNFGDRPEGFEYYDGERYRQHKMSGLLTVNTTDAYQAAGLAGLGIIQCPLIGVRHLLNNGQLVEVLPSLQAEPMPLRIVYPYRRLQARRRRVFVDWLEPIIKGYLT